MAKLKQAWLCSSGLTKTFHFMAPFLAMAELKQALFLLIWLNENVENVVSKKLDGHRLRPRYACTPTEVHMYPDRGTHALRPKRDDFQIFLTSLLGFKRLVGTGVLSLFT